MKKKRIANLAETATPTQEERGAPKPSGARYFQALAAVVLLSAVVFYLFPPESQELSFAKEGAPALAFVLPLADGSGDLSWERDLAGRVVLLNFWATWCAPCLEEMPSLDRLHDKLEAEGLTVVAISEDNYASLAANFAAKEKLKFPVLFDAEHRVAKQWGTFKYPESYIVGRDGRVEKKFFGPAEWDAEEALAYFRGLLASGTDAGPNAPEIPSDPSAARSPEREAMRRKIEERGGAPGGGLGPGRQGSVQ